MSTFGCPSEDQLRAFQLGDLPEPALADVARHLETCARCETLARQLDTGADSILSDLREPSDDGLVTAVVPSGSAAKSGPMTFAFLRPPVEPDEIGRLGNYRVLRLLAKGGMAYIFHAEDVRLGRPVALKVMKPELTAHTESCLRFQREARVMARIKHENVVPVYDVGQEGVAVYLCMELLEGESLGARLDRIGPGSAAEIVRIARDIARGLAVVHRHGLVHRDLTPGNIWLEAPGDRVKILDFGLARSTQEDADVTTVGTVMGTPAFMSPEQARGEKVDSRSDLFSLGCVLYLLCTGSKPFVASNTTAFLLALALHDPKPVREVNSAIPRPLAALIDQLLKKKREDRPASAEAVVERLEQMKTDDTVPLTPRGRGVNFLTPLSPRGRGVGGEGKYSRRGIWAAALVIVLLLIGTAVWLAPRRRAHLGAVPVNADAPDAVYLNELTVVDAEHWPFPDRIPGPPMPEQPDWPPPLGGHRVVVEDRPSPHGVWMHLPPPPRQLTSVSFALRGQFASFHTSISLNDGPPECIPLTFTVYGDGRELWHSKPVASQADTQTAPAIAVQGVETLTLEVTGAGFEAGTHAVWVEPYVKR